MPKSNEIKSRHLRRRAFGGLAMVSLLLATGMVFLRLRSDFVEDQVFVELPGDLAVVMASQPRGMEVNVAGQWPGTQPVRGYQSRQRGSLPDMMQPSFWRTPGEDYFAGTVPLLGVLYAHGFEHVTLRGDGTPITREETEHDERIFDRILSSPLPFWSVTVPYGLILLASLAMPLAWFAERMGQAIRADRRRAQGRCAACGYDLRASAGRCPECGAMAAEEVKGKW